MSASVPNPFELAVNKLFPGGAYPSGGEYASLDLLLRVAGTPSAGFGTDTGDSNPGHEVLKRLKVAFPGHPAILQYAEMLQGIK